MLELYHEARFAEPMAAVFAALSRALADGRWNDVHAYAGSLALPRTGLRYSARRGGHICHGEVLECLRPVSLVLQETLQRSQWGIGVRQRWRVEPLATETRLCSEIRATLSRIASLQRRHWQARLEAERQRVHAQIRAELARAAEIRAQSGTIGQSIGSVSIVSTKRISVSGKPILK